MARVGHLAYRLDMQGRFSKVHPVFHISLLRPYLEGGDGRGAPDEIDESGDSEFEVDRIL